MPRIQQQIAHRPVTLGTYLKVVPTLLLAAGTPLIVNAYYSARGWEEPFVGATKYLSMIAFGTFANLACIALGNDIDGDDLENNGHY